MSDATVIKEFLVALGFKIDPANKTKFQNAMVEATAKAVVLGLAVTAAAATVVAGVAKMADNFEKLYFASQRTGASVENIQSFGFAVGQMGGDAATALASLEALGSKMRHSPGFEGLIKNQGVQTRINGELRDTVDILGDMSKQFAAMPMYRGLAVAEAMGIDEKTFLAMRNGMGEFGDDYRHMLRSAGVESQNAAKSSHEFMNELRLLGASFSVLAQKVVSTMTGKLGGNIKRFRVTIVENFGRITDIIAKVLGFVLKLADALGTMVMRGIQVISRLVDWFGGLSTESQTIIKWIGGILIAWKLLSAGFLATPLGRLTMLITSLALLWDDYQTWKEGGKSLIDWEKWSPGIEAAINGIKSIVGAFHEGLSFLGDWRAAFEIFLAYIAGTWMLGMLGSLNAVVAAMGASALAGTIGSWAKSAAILGAAGAVGYAIGTAIYDNLIKGSKFGNGVGRFVASLLGALGNKDAQEAMRINDAAEAADRAKKVAPAPVLGGSGAVPPPAPPTTDEKGAMNLLQGLGWAKDHAAGIVANLQRESHLKADAVGDSGQAYGIAQWHPDRQAAFKEKYGKDIKGSSLEDQLRFVNFELTEGAEKKAGALLKASRSAEEAGMVVSKNYERPADMNGEAALRGAAATRLAAGGVSAGKKVDINQTTSITITGAGDPARAARDVVTAQNDVNETLIRNTRGAIVQ